MTTKTTSKVSIAAIAAIAAYIAIGAFFANAEAAPNITAQIQNSSNTVITSAQIGASVHDVVQLASSTASTTPQGTVDFNVYANTSCSGSPTTQSNVALVNGFATSSATTVGAGGLSYKVHYDGDVNNIAADGACMPLTALSSSAAITTNLSAGTITAGQSVNDTATLSGVTSNASGTVQYSVFSNSGCTTPFGGAGIVSVVNGVVPNSPPFQFNNPGTYYWQVVYSGDMNNNAATSTCANEVLTVQAVQGKNSPTISTQLSSSSVRTGTNVHDSAVLTGETSNASGTVAYKVFTNSSCSSLFANAGSKSVTNGNALDSDNIMFNSAGTYYWQAIYSGDGQNNAATSTCNNEILTVAAEGSTTPPAGSGTISGTVYNDKNKNDVRDSGEEGLAGFSINLYEGANFSGDYDPVFKTVTTDTNGNYSFTGLANGTYSLEQLIKDGWKQTTDDFASVTIASSVGASGLNFGDVAKSDSGKNCKIKDNKNNKGKHLGWVKHKKDCKGDNDDKKDNHHATSTSPWNNASTTQNWASSTKSLIFRSLQDLGNGLHIGVVVGKLNKHK